MSPGPQGPNQQQFLCPSFATFIIHLFLRTEQHKEGGEGDADTAERIITVAKFNRVDDNYHAHPQVIDSFEVQKCKNYLYAAVWLCIQKCLFSFFFWHLKYRDGLVFCLIYGIVWLMSTFCQMHPCLSLIRQTLINDFSRWLLCPNRPNRHNKNSSIWMEICIA